jgi:type I restriction enzyme S subunit
MRMEPLGNHVRFIRGVTFKPTDKCEAGERGSLVCLRTANVQETLDESDLIAIPASIVTNPEKIVRRGDVLVSSANSWNLVGKCCRVESLKHPSTAGGFISILRATSSELDPAFLYRWFASDRTQATVRSFGNQTTNISNLDHKRTLALSIPLPPLPEQKRIAAILDAADALRAKRRESIEQLDSLVQATFLEMFGDPVTNPKGWNSKEAATIVKEGTSITYGIVQAGDEFPGGVPYIRSGDIVNGEVAVEQLRRTNPAIAAKFERSRVDAGDIVMSIRATVGTSAIVTNGVAGANLTQGTARISPSSQVRSTYLLHYIRTEGCQQWIQQQVKGATFREITLGRLRQMPVLLPPLLLQTRFASIVESIEQQKARLKAHLAELDTLFASLQSRAFNGELVA